MIRITNGLTAFFVTDDYFENVNKSQSIQHRETRPEEVRGLIQKVLKNMTKDKWCGGHFAENALGGEVHYSDKGAAKRCVMGWISFFGGRKYFSDKEAGWLVKTNDLKGCEKARKSLEEMMEGDLTKEFPKAKLD